MLATKRLAVTAALAVAAYGAATQPVTGAVPVGACSAQSAASSTNANTGDVDRSDAKALADAESRCKLAEGVARNVENVLNRNIRDNVSELVADNLNHSVRDVLNDNIRHWARGSAVTF